MTNPFKSKINESVEALEALQSEFDTLNEQFATLQGKLKDVTELSATYKSEFERVDAENKDLKEQLEASTLETAEVIQDSLEVDELASLKAVEILADAGHEQVEVLEDESEDFDTNPLFEQFKSLKGSEAAKFFKDNKQAIMDAYRK